MPEPENPLREEIKAIIRDEGPLAISKYMEMCLLHPVHGYYVKQDPLGRGGDFTTAPEISQMFGEIIGIWALDWWLKNKDIGQGPITLIELGPGRGTLMADAVRAIGKAAPDLPIDIHFVEASPTLTGVQEKKFAKSNINISWHTSLDALPDTPAIFIANEFFDALPIDQIILKDDMLYHHCVGLNDQDELIFGVGHPVSSGLDIDLGTVKMIAKAGEGTILEVSPHRLFAMEEVAKHIADNEGAGIIIDYGFAQLLGIQERADILKTQAKDEKTKTDLDQACKRLTEKEQMGDLFKVMILQAKGKIPPAPFSTE